MQNPIKFISLGLVYLTLMGLVGLIDLVYPELDRIALSKRTSCG